VKPLKSTSRGQGRLGDQPSEGSLSAPTVGPSRGICEPTNRNCIRPNRRASQQSLPRETFWVQHDEARPDHCEMVNAEVVQRKIVSLPGVVRHSGIYLPKLSNDSGGTEPAKVRVNRVEVSRRRELRAHSEERSEGSVMGGICVL
jgi:hypothetical protein